MTGAGADRRLGFLDGLVYADAFDCALYLDEVWRYASAACGRDELREALSQDPELRSLVLQRDGLVCFADRPEMIPARGARRRRARRLQRQARHVSRILRHVPFVRGLALTGSAAADDAPEGADVDLLVVVAPGRLGLVFLLLGTVSRLTRRRLFCPNYYACLDDLSIEPRGIYVAHELVQARSLTGLANDLLDANPWIASVLPNAPGGQSSPLPAAGRIQRLAELPLRGGLGDRAEARARRIAGARLAVHYGGSRAIPREVEADLAAGRALRFHAGGSDERALRRYNARRAEVAERLGAQPADHPGVLTR